MPTVSSGIGDPGDGGQLGYYACKSDERTRATATASRLGNLCLWLGVAPGVTLAMLHRWLDSDTATRLVAVISVLAIIAAARESCTYHKADRERLKQYRFMHQLHASARKSLDGEINPHAKCEVLRALGEASLAEHAEWALMHRERPLEHGRL